MSFKLFPFLEWYNVKKYSDSFEKRLYDDHLDFFSTYGFLSNYNSMTNSFELIKAAVIIQSIMNKNKIERETELYTDIELNKQSRNVVIHSRLPYFEYEGTKIYVPFFTREFNIHYDTELDSLTRSPFITLQDDFESSVVDPFDTYGFNVFDSNFTRLIKIDEYEDEHVAVFYHIGFETIYVINNQGGCDVRIPIFDSDLKKRNHYDLFKRVSRLMKYYFDDDRKGFIESLKNEELISEHLYEEILRGTAKINKKRVKRVKKGRDINE